MPKLPDKFSLGTAIPTPSPAVRPVDVSGAYRGLSKLGAAIAGFGEEQRQKDDALELIKAEAEQRKGLYEIQRQFSEDGDYNTFDQRSADMTHALTERTASMISNSRARQMWEAKASMENEAARDRILRHGLNLKRETQLSELYDSLDNNFNIIADRTSNKDDRSRAESAIDESLKLAMKTGIIDPGKEHDLRNKYHRQSEELLIRDRLYSGENPESILKDLGDYYGPAKVRVISPTLETGDANWRKGVKQVVRDKSGTFSYGNFGLNSGGSMQEFVKRYGSRFNLTAKPGTDEFKKQWEAAAANQASDLHAAEMDWYGRQIGSRVADKLISIGVPSEIAMDTRVQTYFGDRLVQQGPAIIKNHASRILGTLRPGINAEEFLASVTEADIAAVGGDFKTVISEQPEGSKRERFIEGLRNRSRRRLEMSMGGDEGEYKGPYKYLTPTQRHRLINVIKTANHAASLQELADAEKIIVETGSAPVDASGRTALDRAAIFLTPNQMQKAKLGWYEAEQTHKAVAPLMEMNPSQAQDHLDKLLPSPSAVGEHYAISQKVYNRAEKEFDRIMREREKDPAALADSSRAVHDAKMRIKSLGIRVPPAIGYEYLIEARKAYQTAMGIPESLQKIITNNEAKQLLQMPRNVDPVDVDVLMQEAAKRAVKTYGKNAARAMRDAINLQIRTKTVREEALAAAEELSQKPAVEKETGWLDSIYSMFGFGSEQEPQKPEQKSKSPTDAQINWALSDPENRSPVFDREFGAGSFARILVERKLGAGQ
jgi:hypothetical protein